MMFVWLVADQWLTEQTKHPEHPGKISGIMVGDSGRPVKLSLGGRGGIPRDRLVWVGTKSRGDDGNGCMGGCSATPWLEHAPPPQSLVILTDIHPTERSVKCVFASPPSTPPAIENFGKLGLCKYAQVRG